MAILDDFLDRIELLNDDFMWYNYKNSPATIEQIEDYERSYGISFNEEVRTFLLSLGAVILEVEEKIWPRPQEYDVVPAWEFGYGMFIYGLSSDKDMLSWLTYDEKYKETASSGNRDYGQMFYKRSGNLYRAYINSEGIITVLENGIKEEGIIFDGNFYDFLINEIDKLEEDYKDYIKKHYNK